MVLHPWLLLKHCSLSSSHPLRSTPLPLSLPFVTICQRLTKFPMHSILYYPATVLCRYVYSMLTKGNERQSTAPVTLFFTTLSYVNESHALCCFCLLYTSSQFTYHSLLNVQKKGNSVFLISYKSLTYFYQKKFNRRDNVIMQSRL